MPTSAESLCVLDAEIDIEQGFRTAVLSGLSRPVKQIPSKFFYDAEGSRLFEKICTLDEYYPTRAETEILTDRADEIAALLPEGMVLLEFGSGASLKVRLLLDALDRPRCYVPIDISREHLLAAANSLSRDYRTIPVSPVYADFTRPFRLPDAVPAGPRLGFFPGSTIGNFHPPEATHILARFAERLGPGGWLLIGVDLKKDHHILHAAYNDVAGVTAAFNLNLLTRINRELDGSFDLDGFRHRAVYNTDAGRIEMYLMSRHTQVASVAGRTFRFRAGESIHTENSYKYSLPEFSRLAVSAGYRPAAVWCDSAGLFSVHLLAVEARAATASATRWC
jgi:dimethylhistidine N-methyltransferase